MGEHATPKQKVLVDDNFKLRWSAAGAPSAAGIYSSLEGLIRCLLNTCHMTVLQKKRFNHHPWYTQISYLQIHTLWRFSFLFDIPILTKQPQQQPNAGCGDFFVRGDRKKHGHGQSCGRMRSARQVLRESRPPTVLPLHWKGRWQGPWDQTMGWSDEQFVRQVLYYLFPNTKG